MGLQIDTLVTQHKQLLDIVTGIRMLNPEKDSQAIAEQLGKLGEVLTSHLTLEDKELYPALRAYGEKPEAPVSLKTNVKMFFDEMETLKPVVTAFLAKWNAGAIAKSSADFRKEFGDVTKALNNRIVLEESRLYTLYNDKVAAALT